MQTSSLAREIADAGVEGVTFLGGEPFDQAVACASLAELLRSLAIGVITFTGFTHAVLASGRNAGWTRLLNATDLLVDGRYEKTRPEKNRAWVGSENQRFVHLSDRYEGLQPEAHVNRLELRVSPSGEVEVGGLVTIENVTQLRSTLEAPVSIGSRR